MSVEFDRLMQKRKVYTATGLSVLYPIQNVPHKGLVCIPIVSIILVDINSVKATETHIKLGQFVASLFGEQMSS